MVKRAGERAKRKDKKKQIRPWLPGSHLAEIQSLAKFSQHSAQASIMEYLVTRCVKDRTFIEYVKPLLIRTIKLPSSYDSIYYSTLIGNQYPELTAHDLYQNLKIGVTRRASFYVTKDLKENYLVPLTSGLDISYDGLASIAIDFTLRELLGKIAPGYITKYVNSMNVRHIQRKVN
ncbi:hypothetical protein ACFYU8_18105 [Brevibacillus sp. NPDC003359]|uniref:hypothetical protein n=1 Tax=unclassified Brevibacillus TaxID=2684853 RepID=UPI00367B7BCB